MVWLGLRLAHTTTPITNFRPLQPPFHPHSVVDPSAFGILSLFDGGGDKIDATLIALPVKGIHIPNDLSDWSKSVQRYLKRQYSFFPQDKTRQLQRVKWSSREVWSRSSCASLGEGSNCSSSSNKSINRRKRTTRMMTKKQSRPV